MLVLLCAKGSEFSLKVMSIWIGNFVILNKIEIELTLLTSRVLTNYPDIESQNGIEGKGEKICFITAIKEFFLQTRVQNRRNFLKKCKSSYVFCT